MSITWDDLQAFIEDRNSAYEAERNSTFSPREQVLARCLKLMEEMGELSDEILGRFNYQRQIKLAARKAGGLEEELADVLITLLLVARSMDVDVPLALQKKMAKIRGRTA